LAKSGEEEFFSVTFTESHLEWHTFLYIFFIRNHIEVGATMQETKEGKEEPAKIAATLVGKVN
jgi:hypothetical protein